MTRAFSINKCSRVSCDKNSFTILASEGISVLSELRIASNICTIFNDLETPSNYLTEINRDATSVRVLSLYHRVVCMY